MILRLTYTCLLQCPKMYLRTFICMQYVCMYVLGQSTYTTTILFMYVCMFVCVRACPTHLPIAGIQARALGLVEVLLGFASRSERYPPSRVELKPPTVITSALPLEKACKHTHTYIHTAWTRRYFHSFIHTYIHTYINTCKAVSNTVVYYMVMYVCMYVCMNECLYVCRMYVLYVCMYVCMCVYKLNHFLSWKLLEDERRFPNADGKACAET